MLRACRCGHFNVSEADAVLAHEDAPRLITHTLSIAAPADKRMKGAHKLRTHRHWTKKRQTHSHLSGVM